MSYATRGARAGEMAWPPLSRPGDTPHPPYGAPPSLSRLIIVAPAGCPCGPSQQLPRADRGHLGVGGWQGTGFFAGFLPGGPGGATAFGFDAEPVVSRGVQPPAVSIPARRRPLWQGGEHCPPFGLVG